MTEGKALQNENFEIEITMKGDPVNITMTGQPKWIGFIIAGIHRTCDEQNINFDIKKTKYKADEKGTIVSGTVSVELEERYADTNNNAP